VTPKSNGSVTKKSSIIDRFGGLFVNHKEKEKDPTIAKKPVKKSTKKGKDKDKDKDKDKTTGGLVKKDSFKRKIGSKPKQEVYVTTPVVRQKHPHLHVDGVIGANDIPSTAAITITSSNSNENKTAVTHDEKGVSVIINNKSKETAYKATSKGNGIKSGQVGNTTEDRNQGKKANGASNQNKNGVRNGAKTKARSPVDGSCVDGPSVDGSSVDPEEDTPRRSLLLGNVKNKRKLFENAHGRDS
jgi:hypothetical protein